MTKKGPRNNGRVGQWGISCPGFYTTVGLRSRHPALKVASPQAPVTDWFWDDHHHNGAYFLTSVMGFENDFGQPRPASLAQYPPGPQMNTPNGYAFYQRLGPLKNVNEHYFHGQYKHWNDVVAHPNYDAFWQARNSCPHLRDQKPAVLVVSGFNDAEDLFGTLNTYQAIKNVESRPQQPLRDGPLVARWLERHWRRNARQRGL